MLLSFPFSVQKCADLHHINRESECVGGAKGKPAYFMVMEG